MFDLTKIEKPAQSQIASENALAMQAAGDIHHTTIIGPTLEQMHSVALTIFKENFYELAGLAKDIANQRASEITEKFLEKLIKEYPKAFQKADDPDFQYSLLTLQREYAKTGDKDLGDLLVDLLVDRSKQNQRDILQIVLNESLATAPKLTTAQASVLSLIFYSRYVHNKGIVTIDKLCEELNKFIDPISEDIAKIKNSSSIFQHLEFAGCGTTTVSNIDLVESYKHRYGGLFSSGFESQIPTARELTAPSTIYMQCISQPKHLQFRAINTEVLAEMLQEALIEKDKMNPYFELFNQSLMDNESVSKLIMEKSPVMKMIFEVWNTTDLRSFTLTSVGMAIGHANIKKSLGVEFAPLSLWIN